MLLVLRDAKGGLIRILLLPGLCRIRLVVSGSAIIKSMVFVRSGLGLVEWLYIAILSVMPVSGTTWQTGYVFRQSLSFFPVPCVCKKMPTISLSFAYLTWFRGCCPELPELPRLPRLRGSPGSRVSLISLSLLMPSCDGEYSVYLHIFFIAVVMLYRRKPSVYNETNLGSNKARGTPRAGVPIMSARNDWAFQSPRYSILSYFCARRTTIVIILSADALLVHHKHREETYNKMTSQ